MTYSISLLLMTWWPGYHRGCDIDPILPEYFYSGPGITKVDAQWTTLFKHLNTVTYT